MSSYMLEIKRHIDMAKETDYIMPLWMPFIPIILSVIGMFIFIASLVGGGVMGLLVGIPILFVFMIIGGILSLYVIYKLVKRRNEHFRRTHLLYENLVNLLKEKEGSSPEIISMQSTLQEMRYDEGEKSAGLYAILVLFLGIIIWFYVAHFLNKDFRKHEIREARLIDTATGILKKYGAEVPIKFEREFPERSTILYIVLSIVTLGIFMLYWVYTLANDPNNHFMQHRVIEGKLLSTIESAKII